MFSHCRNLCVKKLNLQGEKENLEAVARDEKRSRKLIIYL